MKSTQRLIVDMQIRVGQAAAVAPHGSSCTLREGTNRAGSKHWWMAMSTQRIDRAQVLAVGLTVSVSAAVVYAIGVVTDTTGPCYAQIISKVWTTVYEMRLTSTESIPTVPATRAPR